MIKKIISVFLALALCLCLFFYFNKSIFRKDPSTAYGVSSSNSIAVEVGMKVLENGGNSIDAAAAISYVLGVVEPYGSGIGGGGCMLVYLPQNDEYKFYDYREVASESEHADEIKFGVPGFVKGIEYVQSEHGKLDMSELIQYSIDLARDGFSMNKNLYNRLKDNPDLERLPEFFDEGGQPKKEGSTVVQNDLADTLTQIKNEGSAAFYKGVIAEKLVKDGYLTEGDLDNYTVKAREPITSTFNGYDITTAPAPFSGITLVQMLNMIEYRDVPSYDEEPAKYLDEMSNIVNIAYASRLANISDPDFAKENKDYQKLATKEYSKYLYEKNETKALDDKESKDTTSFVVVDSNGMVVSCTNTLGELFGNKIYTQGFFLNNSSANFNDKEHSINYMEPGKRSRTFISPAIIKKGDDFIMGIGSPGGNVIPQAMAQVINYTLRDGIALEEAVQKSRFVFVDDKEIYCEEEISQDVVGETIQMGCDYEFIVDKSNLLYGSIHAILRDMKNGAEGASDSRRRGEYEIKYN